MRSSVCGYLYLAAWVPVLASVIASHIHVMSYDVSGGPRRPSGPFMQSIASYLSQVGSI